MILDIITKRNYNAPPLLKPADVNGSATVKSDIMDAQGARGVEILFVAGTVAGGGHYVVTIQESETTNDTDFTDVAATDLVNGAQPASISATGQIRSAGYLGVMRYIRAKLVKSGTVSTCFLTIVGALEYAQLMPGSNPSPPPTV